MIAFSNSLDIYDQSLALIIFFFNEPGLFNTFRNTLLNFIHDSIISCKNAFFKLI